MDSPNWTKSPLGMGWRAPLAALISQHPHIGFVELIAENFFAPELPQSLQTLLSKGTCIIPHGVSLSLGSPQPLDKAHLRKLAHLCRQLKAPFFSEHIAFVRHGHLDTAQLLPVPRTPKMLGLLSDHAKQTSDVLGVPLVLENIAQLFAWPDQVLEEADWLNALCHHAKVTLLLDVSNLYANLVNGLYGAVPHHPEALPHAPEAVLRRLEVFLKAINPDHIRYLHVAGGQWKDGFYVDTHAQPIDGPISDVIKMTYETFGPVPTLLERDHHFISHQAMADELNYLQDLLSKAAPSSAVRPAPSFNTSSVLSAPTDEDLQEAQGMLLRFLLEDGEPPSFFSPQDAERVRAAVLRKENLVSKLKARRRPRSFWQRMKDQLTRWSV